jgi:hypothetical protein
MTSGELMEAVRALDYKAQYKYSPEEFYKVVREMEKFIDGSLFKD